MKVPFEETGTRSERENSVEDMKPCVSKSVASVCIKTLRECHLCHPIGRQGIGLGVGMNLLCFHPN
jgi:hypothetical protein